MGNASSTHQGTSAENMPIASKAISKLVTKLISENSVMVFSKSHCQFCQRVKHLLADKGIKFKTLELDLENNGSSIQDHLASITGQRTVPSVFANGHHVGGCDDTFVSFKANKFAKLLEGPLGKFAEQNKTEDSSEGSASNIEGDNKAHI
ncbi:Glutaredoxin [Coemansia spiralis]|uniref:Glutaredoxin n=2 Tax=Coemansia TaxID=4863 RepID=A0A9W8L096_9FUNG|nr:thioredoxin-like protein [Coemansia spiralis]KAJ1994912.1 Glutaredoxin [Coemansia umbellata]KAJ2624650.1 Glutaredoxin [Coemansia sp. RSA 1358]KAJ2679764.1 Glutaredoxin [Coemansia spiralis]